LTPPILPSPDTTAPTMTPLPHPGLSCWLTLTDAEKQAARAYIHAIVTEHGPVLVDAFYAAFLNDSTSAAFLSHTVVQERLASALANWLRTLIETDPVADVEAFQQQQIRIGKVHARIGIPTHLVLAGATILKTEIGRRIAGQCQDPQVLTHSLLLLVELIDAAMQHMTTAYETSTREVTRDNEAYRFLALAEDMDLERESQRAALMEWSHGVLFGLLAEPDAGSSTISLGASSFGLWVRHRARHLFSGADLLRKIEEAITEIDNTLLPEVRSSRGSAGQTAAITALHDRVEEIKFLLGSLFQAASSVENGRDPLTRTLNRRFLPGLLSREFALVKSGNVPLSLLMVDVDHFKSINDTFGHSAGDTVLKRVAETVLDSVRASDFVFRYGGEEFLVVLVETEREKALVIAERLRSKVEEMRVPLDGAPPVTVTVSIGLATHEGHPDPQYLIDRADQALYKAKAEGRNRVVMT